MYKLLIVDDDGIIRRGLSQNIMWKDIGFELLGTANDGEIALKMIEKEQPQIIISDIKMPFMDGLQLTRLVKAKYPQIKVILLTGYEEFEYAKEALKLKVFDYVLKPVDNELLIETVKRAVCDFEKEEKSKKQITESLPLLKQKFLVNLINGDYLESELLSEIDYLKLPLVNGNCIVLLLKLDDYKNSNYNLEVMEKELLKFSIQNICEEIAENTGNSVFIDLLEDEAALIFTDKTLNNIALLNKVSTIAESLREKVFKYLKTTITIGIGNVYSDIKEINKSYKDAYKAIEFRYILGKNKVLFIQDVSGYEKKSSFHFDIEKTEIIEKIKLGLKNESIKILSDIEEKIVTEKLVSLTSIRLLGVEIAILLYNEVDGFKEYCEQTYSEKNYYNFSNRLQGLETVQEIFSELRGLISDICIYILEKRGTQQQNIVQSAMKFIAENYAREGLSLQDVANIVHVSPIYLSIIFKQEKGINFSDYLLEIRMKKAMELIRSKDIKIYEVSDKVGYSNAQYFSVCFKKYTGFSPSEFKNC